MREHYIVCDREEMKQIKAYLQEIETDDIVISTDKLDSVSLEAQYNVIYELNTTEDLIVLTDKPTVLLGASEGATMCKAYIEDDEVGFTTTVPCKNWTYNSLVSSPYFDQRFCSRVMDPHKVSSDDYIYSLMHGRISEHIKRQGTSINEEEIIRLIDEELEKI